MGSTGAVCMRSCMQVFIHVEGHGHTCDICCTVIRHSFTQQSYSTRCMVVPESSVLYWMGGIMVCSLLLSAKAVLFTIFHLLATHHHNHFDAVSLWPNCALVLWLQCVWVPHRKRSVLLQTGPDRSTHIRYCTLGLPLVFPFLMLLRNSIYNDAWITSQA